MKPYWKITLWYLLFGMIWIVVSDTSLFAFVVNSEKVNLLQTIKGCGYVIVSGLFINNICKVAFKKQEAEEKERIEVYVETVRATNHILRNYLNQMQLVTLEAERCKDFDREILELSRVVTTEAEAQIERLGSIHEVSAQHINATTKIM